MPSSKILAYVDRGYKLSDTLKEQYRNSLIFIGDEGQIYSPAVDTYVGIGHTAYTNTIAYIENAYAYVIEQVGAALNDIINNSLNHNVTQVNGLEKKITILSSEKDSNGILISNDERQTDFNNNYAAINTSGQEGSSHLMTNGLNVTSYSVWVYRDAGLDNDPKAMDKYLTYLPKAFSWYNTTTNSKSGWYIHEVDGQLVEREKNGTPALYDIVISENGLNPFTKKPFPEKTDEDKYVWIGSYVYVDDKKTVDYVKKSLAYSITFTKYWNDKQNNSLYGAILGVDKIPVYYDNLDSVNENDGYTAYEYYTESEANSYNATAAGENAVTETTFKGASNDPTPLNTIAIPATFISILPEEFTDSFTTLDGNNNKIWKTGTEAPTWADYADFLLGTTYKGSSTVISTADVTALVNNVNYLLAGVNGKKAGDLKSATQVVKDFYVYKKTKRSGNQSEEIESNTPGGFVKVTIADGVIKLAEDVVGIGVVGDAISNADNSETTDVDESGTPLTQFEGVFTEADGKIVIYTDNTVDNNLIKTDILDGIQTLKEVAYILDTITDGSEDAGISIAYSIAKNKVELNRLNDFAKGMIDGRGYYKDPVTNDAIEFNNVNSFSYTNTKYLTNYIDTDNIPSILNDEIIQVVHEENAEADIFKGHIYYQDIDGRNAFVAEADRLLAEDEKLYTNKGDEYYNSSNISFKKLNSGSHLTAGQIYYTKDSNNLYQSFKATGEEVSNNISAESTYYAQVYSGDVRLRTVLQIAESDEEFTRDEKQYAVYDTTGETPVLTSFIGLERGAVEGKGGLDHNAENVILTYLEEDAGLVDTNLLNSYVAHSYNLLVKSIQEAELNSQIYTHETVDLLNYNSLYTKIGNETDETVLGTLGERTAYYLGSDGVYHVWEDISTTGWYLAHPGGGVWVKEINEIGNEPDATTLSHYIKQVTQKNGYVSAIYGTFQVSDRHYTVLSEDDSWTVVEEGSSLVIGKQYAYWDGYVSKADAEAFNATDPAPAEPKQFHTFIASEATQVTSGQIYYTKTRYVGEFDGTQGNTYNYAKLSVEGDVINLSTYTYAVESVTSYGFLADALSVKSYIMNVLEWINITPEGMDNDRLNAAYRRFEGAKTTNTTVGVDRIPHFVEFADNTQLTEALYGFSMNTGGKVINTYVHKVEQAGGAYVPVGNVNGITTDTDTYPKYYFIDNITYIDTFFNDGAGNSKAAVEVVGTQEKPINSVVKTYPGKTGELTDGELPAATPLPADNDFR